MMGTTLQGVIEAHEPARVTKSGVPYFLDHWWKIAEIEFNKDYSLMFALSDYAVEGWPESASISDAERRERFIEAGNDLQHADLEIFRHAVRSHTSKDDEKQEGACYASPVARAALDFMESLSEYGLEVRILFYRS